MKITKVNANNRKKALEIESPKGSYSLPYSKLKLKPSPRNKIKSVYVDSELGNEAITYVLDSGKEDSVHLDAFLDYNRDPDFMRGLMLHNLTVEAIQFVKKSGLSKHELTRRLKTSPSQLSRLLDPANQTKSIDEMFRLLAILGYRADVRIVEIAA